MIASSPQSPNASPGLLIVLPFYSGDVGSLVSNLIWMKELDGPVPYHCLLSTDFDTPVGVAKGWASRVFAEVHTYQYKRVRETHWPWPQNNAFMQTAWHVAAKFKTPWLWVETDSIPLCPGWIDKLWDEYKKGGKPFGGHVNTTGIFNGVAIYPTHVSTYSTRCLTAALMKNHKGQQDPWDAYASKQVIKYLHPMNSLMQHVWDAPQFPDTESVKSHIRPGVVLYHRNKSGSLIKQLRKMRRQKA